MKREYKSNPMNVPNKQEVNNIIHMDKSIATPQIFEKSRIQTNCTII